LVKAAPDVILIRAEKYQPS